VDPEIKTKGLSWTRSVKSGEIMSETKKRNVHLPEFKAKVGLEAVRGVMTINEIGQAHGVHPVQVSQWKKEIQEQAKTLFEGKRGPPPTASQIGCTARSGASKWSSTGSKKSPGSACHDAPRLG
jgi:transposase-like protein